MMDQRSRDYGYRDSENDVLGESDAERTLMMVESGVIAKQNSMVDVCLDSMLLMYFVHLILMNNKFTNFINGFE